MLNFRNLSVLVLLLAAAGFSGCAGGTGSAGSGMSRILSNIKAGPAESRGDDAYNSRDYVAAFEAYHDAAKSGGQYGQLRLATMYFLGEGVAPDQGKYLEWMGKSAESGYPPANYLMGMHAVSRDAAAAAGYFKNAAGNEHGPSMHMLGMMHARGIGVPQSNSEALRWFRMAKSQGVSVDEGLLSESGISDYMKKIAAPVPRSRKETPRLEDAAKAKPPEPPVKKEDIASIATRELQPEPSQNVKETLDKKMDQKQLLLEIQQHLLRLGYKPGIADGIYGGKTREAITAFQRKKGLDPNGLATEKLLGILKNSTK